ncbi:arabinan endo-1,5-alpha-L-arabinosidase [Xanthomonas sp. AmX2]|uniref:arabinan endo-1,5-alpha-L-arabinosidase n=1 Tax=Xanthomonas sp. TaxID=29446 RepID=UPI00197D5F3E|nr:arabinan endo-1,5-alpha-L-arabinosidase [Xanthomonas sp.]MBN6150886.1 arabinan endo-1,5-alpha-L-arabinosidase [Xanthomonas sp.]
MSAASLRLTLAALAVLLAGQAFAQAPPAGADAGASMLEQPPIAVPRKGYHADVLAHDPVMIRQGKTWYLFITGPGISVYSSRNMRTWKAEPPVFAQIPAWTEGVVPRFNGHIWAPDISFHDGVYTLYYSVSSGGKNTSAIGVATNTTLDPKDPAFAWKDHGILIRSLPQRDLWNAIDPNLVEDAQGTPWLSFGSFWGGLKLVRLNPDRVSLAEPQQWHTLAKRERSVLVDDAEPEPAALEAPFVFKKNGWYYLFLSWDHCCRGVKSDYKIMVGRAREATGPYLDKDGKRLDQGGGSLVLEGTPRWFGPGHNSAYTFNGKDYLVFHAYDGNDGGRPKLKVLPLRWDAQQWPRVDAKALQK